MNEDNYTQLVNQSEQLGFGRDTSLELLNRLFSGQPQFSIKHEAYLGNNMLKALLQFRKSEETGMYALDNYKLQVNKENGSEVMNQTFYINGKDEHVTLKEAYNLLQGRAVLKELSSKEGEKHKAWIQLDFKETDGNNNYKFKKYDEGNGFDLNSVLSKYPIKELTSEQDRKCLTTALEEGSRPYITHMNGDSEKRMFIEAVPQFKSIRIYDSDMKRLKPEQLVSEVYKSASITKNERMMKQQGSTDEDVGKKSNIKSKSRSAGIH